MRGRVGVFITVASVCGLTLVVSLASARGAGPEVTRMVVIEHATDMVVDLTPNGDSTGDFLTFPQRAVR